jgi:hypothetical protein
MFTSTDYENKVLTVMIINSTDIEINKQPTLILTEFEFWCLTPLSAIFQLYHGDQFQWWRKAEYPERTTDPGQTTGNLYHPAAASRVHLFVIYKAGQELTPCW